MSVTTVAVTPATAKNKTKVRYWRCQFCASGHHRSCPRVVWHTTPKGPVLWECECPKEGHHGLYCTSCKCEDQGEVDPEQWRCYDRHGCAARLQVRQENNPVWRMIHAAKVHSAVVKRHKRLMRERDLANVDPFADASIELLHENLEQIEKAEAQKARAQRLARRSPPKPTSGKCECCGEVTRGGRFLPGHDAKLASVLRARVMSGDAEAYEEMKRRGWLKKLPAKLREGV